MTKGFLLAAPDLVLQQWGVLAERVYQPSVAAMYQT